MFDPQHNGGLTIKLSVLLLLSLLLKGCQCNAGRERLTPYQSEDPSPTIPTHRMKEDKLKTVGDKNGAS